MNNKHVQQFGAFRRIIINEALTLLNYAITKQQNKNRKGNSAEPPPTLFVVLRQDFQFSEESHSTRIVR